MPGLNVKTNKGDVFVLDANRILVYGTRGIELTLGQRNLETIRRVISTGETIKDSDTKDARFLVGYDAVKQEVKLEPLKGEPVRVLVGNLPLQEDQA